MMNQTSGDPGILADSFKRGNALGAALAARPAEPPDQMKAAGLLQRGGL